MLPLYAGTDNNEFKGIVKAAPAKGLVGEWKIDNTPVIVTEDSKIDEDDGKLQVGARVEVKFVTYQGKKIVYKIETEH